MILDALFTTLSKSTGGSPITVAFVGALIIGFILGKFSHHTHTKKITPESGSLSRRMRRDSEYKQQSMIHSTAHSINLSTSHISIDLDKELFEELSALVRMGKKLEAIKFLRDRKATDLRTAKEFVELVETHLERVQHIVGM